MTHEVEADYTGTSKHRTDDALLEHKGTFLASLSAMSLLSITSHHNEHRSHNSITFHQAQAVERHLPASSYHEINGKHGTRVTVRNLFGNLPVRVKQRPRVPEQKSEHERLWEALKIIVAGQLLAWSGTVAVRARDIDNRVIFSFNTSDLKQKTRSKGSSTAKPRPAYFTSILNVLTQANYITIDDWLSWVPVSASTSTISVKGAISLEPAPTKSVQFISLGVRPLSADLEHNELYDHVNRLFALSSFGAIEDIALDNFEKFRRQSDKRYKSDGYANRQMKSRKGVDRHPMFHLRISLHGDLSPRASGYQFLEDETNVQAIVDILSAMITQWLSIHHSRPVKPHRKRRPDAPSSIPPREPSVDDSSEELTRLPQNDTARSVSRAPAQVPPGAAARQKLRVSTSTSSAPADQLRHTAFAEWSRIKSAKADFFAGTSALPKLGRATSANFMLQPVSQGALNIQTPQRVQVQVQVQPVSESEIEVVGERPDDTMLWTDPLTKKPRLLSARTGCVMPNVPARPGSEPVLSYSGRLKKEMNRSLRLLPKSATMEKTPWLDDMMQTWDNPVFRASEKRIEQVTMPGDGPDHGIHHHGPHLCSTLDINKAFSGVPTAGSARLSKASLANAEVLAQVDKKFVLIKAMSSTDTTLASSNQATLLVLVDQHAADERIQVEALFQELCAPVSFDSTVPRYQSKLGHSAVVTSTLLGKSIQFTVSSQEKIHFATHAQKFADWGVLYDILTPNTSSTKEQHLVSVTALPPSISERCKSDVGLLISFLRSTIWKYASYPHRTSQTSRSPKETSPEWVRRLATCPEGLIDMVKSRACRSAIMFNDELDLEQCQLLVQKLANCVFPFMCAHGRPSMVPLANLNTIGSLGQESQPEVHGRKQSFTQAWKQWKR